VAEKVTKHYKTCWLSPVISNFNPTNINQSNIMNTTTTEDRSPKRDSYISTAQSTTSETKKSVIKFSHAKSIWSIHRRRPLQCSIF